MTLLRAAGGILNQQNSLPYFDQVLADSPVAYWRLDESSGSVLDSSGNNLSGTNNGATPDATGKMGSAYSFDGVDDYIDFGEPTQLDFTGPFTLEAWVWLNATFPTAWRTILGKWNDSSADRSWGFHFGSGAYDGVAFHQKDGSGIHRELYSTLGQSYFVRKWSHLAVVFDPSQSESVRLKLYVDGVLDNEAASGISGFNSTQPVYMGNHTTLNAAWDGMIDEVAIYNTALPASRILAHYNAAPVFDPLADITWEAVYWAENPGWTNPGDGNSLSSGWDDASGNARDLTLSVSGAVYRSSEATLNSRPAIDMSGGRLVSSAFTLAQPYSWVTVARFDDPNPNRMRLIDSDGVGTGRSLFGNSSNRLALEGSTLALVPHPSSPLPSSGPHLHVLYYNGSSSTITQSGVVSSSLNPGTVDVGGVGIGRDSNLAFFDGKVAFVGLYSGDITTDPEFSNFEAWVTSHYGIAIA